MGPKVRDAVNKLFQFGSSTQPDAPVSRKDLAPVLSAVADALMELEKLATPKAPKALRPSEKASAAKNR
jgi:hypothetical protein